jgi:hypothetical protein
MSLGSFCRVGKEAADEYDKGTNSEPVIDRYVALNDISEGTKYFVSVLILTVSVLKCSTNKTCKGLLEQEVFKA